MQRDGEVLKMKPMAVSLRIAIFVKSSFVFSTVVIQMLLLLVLFLIRSIDPAYSFLCNRQTSLHIRVAVKYALQILRRFSYQRSD